MEGNSSPLEIESWCMSEFYREQLLGSLLKQGKLHISSITAYLKNLIPEDKVQSQIFEMANFTLLFLEFSNPDFSQDDGI